jgi:type III secretory pathway lipoprotein EscJ
MKKLGLIFLIAAVTFGCNNSAVVQEATQEQAREVVVTLYERGIAAVMEKQQGGKGVYTVNVPSGRYGEALKIISEKNLPSPVHATFHDFVGSGSIIPSSREIEALRVDHAIGIEIEDLLGRLPGVTAVKAVVREKAELDATHQGVAAVVNRSKGAELSLAQITALISKVVPGISQDKITVQIIDDESAHASADAARKMVPFLWVTFVPESDYKTLAVFFLGCVLVVGVASVLTGYWWGYYRRRDSEGKEV